MSTDNIRNGKIVTIHLTREVVDNVYISTLLNVLNETLWSLQGWEGKN